MKAVLCGERKETTPSLVGCDEFKTCFFTQLFLFCYIFQNYLNPVFFLLSFQFLLFSLAKILPDTKAQKFYFKMLKQSFWHFKIFPGIMFLLFQSIFSHSFGLQRLFCQISYSLKMVSHLIYKCKHIHITPFKVAKRHWPTPAKQDAKLFLEKEGRNEFHPLK